MGKEEKKYEQSRPEEKNVDIVFRHARPYTLYVGREAINFGPNERKSVSASVIKHPDWQHEQKNFSVVNVSRRVGGSK